jgi:septal ring factor EnvC (AmiA/AmiB activator)
MAAVDRAFARAKLGTKFKPMIFQDYSKRTHEEVVKDLNSAHARIGQVVSEFNEAQGKVKSLLGTRDRQEKHIAELDKTIDRQKLMLWIQGAAVTALWGLVMRLIILR